jgi:hypothetical protein
LDDSGDGKEGEPLAPEAMYLLAISKAGEVGGVGFMEGNGWVGGSSRSTGIYQPSYNTYITQVRVWDLYRMRAVAAASLRALFSSLRHLLALPSAAGAAGSSSSSSSSNNRASSPRITRAKVRACVHAFVHWLGAM